MNASKHIVRQGQRYRAAKELQVLCLVSWNFTSVTTHQVTMPEGTVVSILNDTGNTSIAHCVPEDYKKLERLFIPWVFRALFWMYKGYYVSIDQRRLRKDCEFLGHKHDFESGNAGQPAVQARESVG